MIVDTIEETCCNCGVIFWISQQLNSDLVRTKRSFYCPNGHSQSYRGESYEAQVKRLEAEKLQVMRESSQKILELKSELEKKCKKRRKKKLNK